MELTRKQEEGLNCALNKYKAGEKFVTISGYAGSGKSTLVRFIIQALDVEESKVAYATYTGKAAEVLRKKGNKNAMTLHKLLYDSFPRPGGGFFRKPKLVLEYTIVVVDEVSMVPKTMIDMLLAHKIFVIFLGDPFQLPQIDKQQTHTLLDNPDVFLDQIMRQAQESEIIRLTMKIREGKPIEYIKGNEIVVCQSNELVTGMLTWADQIICATNVTRHNINKQIRNLLGYKGQLCEGERVIIKRNYWDWCNEDGDALVNGTVGYVNNLFESYIKLPSFVRSNKREIPNIICNFIPESSKYAFDNLDIDKNFLLREEPCVDWRIAYQLGKSPKYRDLLPKQATYGYAVTCHAAQGSEWDNVLVIEESFPFDKLEHARWLYTAVSRSSKKCVLVR